MVANENKECAPSEIIDIWQYVLFFIFAFAYSTVIYGTRQLIFSVFVLSSHSVL